MGLRDKELSETDFAVRATIINLAVNLLVLISQTLFLYYHIRENSGPRAPESGGMERVYEVFIARDYEDVLM